jgi:hypothetical protein
MHASSNSSRTTFAVGAFGVSFEMGFSVIRSCRLCGVIRLKATPPYPLGASNSVRGPLLSLGRSHSSRPLKGMAYSQRRMTASAAPVCNGTGPQFNLPDGPRPYQSRCGTRKCQQPPTTGSVLHRRRLRTGQVLHGPHISEHGRVKIRTGAPTNAAVCRVDTGNSRCAGCGPHLHGGDLQEDCRSRAAALIAPPTPRT